jgi:hypothetical protein
MKQVDLEKKGTAQPQFHLTSLRSENTRRIMQSLVLVNAARGAKTQPGYAIVGRQIV